MARKTTLELLAERIAAIKEALPGVEIVSLVCGPVAFRKIKTAITDSSGVTVTGQFAFLGIPVTEEATSVFYNNAADAQIVINLKEKIWA